MRIAIITALLAGCTNAGPGDPVPHVELSTDTYFTRPPTGYTTREDCLAHVSDPQQCIASLVLCANGEYEIVIGDVVDGGTYSLDRQIAVGRVMGNALDFTLDLQTGVFTDYSVGGESTWQAGGDGAGLADCAQLPL